MKLEDLTAFDFWSLVVKSKISKGQAIQKLSSLKSEIPSLRSEKSGSAPLFKKWKRNVEVAISNIFGDGTRHSRDFQEIRYGLSIVTTSTPDGAWHDAYVRGLNSADAILQSMIEEIMEYWEGDLVLNNEAALNPVAETSRKIFVVHGHDDALKNEVARFLEKLEFEVVILHEQANAGKTIIEKFESYANVTFAVILLTPDDVGAHKVDPNVTKPRARQNVIFEFGYFIGRLGRHRVCGLLKGDVEVPSDYSGVAYVSVDDSGIWAYMLAKELMSAGLEIDANNVF